MGEAEIFTHAHSQHESLRFPVLGHKADTLFYSVMRVADRHRLSLNGDTSRAGAHAEDHLHDLRTP